MTTSPTTPAGTLDLTALAVGDELARTTHTLDRDALVRYAGASGDFNPIHYNDAVAEEAGLPGVIAHGMLTMGTAIAGLLEAVGDPTLVTAYSTRFTGMVPVPATGEVSFEVVATVGAIDQDARTARVDLTAEVDGAKVLGRARATLALPAAGQDGSAGQDGA
jgi:acyl dehydratase